MPSRILIKLCLCFGLLWMSLAAPALRASSDCRVVGYSSEQVDCRQVSGDLFSMCGTSCPTGYYVDALNADSVNCPGSLFENNKVDCRQVSGDFFSTCGTSCPAGYVVSALKSDPLDCSGDLFKNNRVDCRGASVFIRPESPARSGCRRR